MNILLTVSYDGTNYAGWQIQNNETTVQGTLSDCLSGLYNTQINILGASRTDAGVHALAQRALFFVPDELSKIPLDKLPEVINKRLPKDIVITSATEAENGFHPIASAKQKTYEYCITNSKYANPLTRNYMWHVTTPLDIDAIVASTQFFLGEHDFIGFSSSGRTVKTTVRTIYNFEVISKSDNTICLKMTGNGFLYNMVRIIAGTMYEVGIGKIKPHEIPDIIFSKNRKRAGKTAPAHGLTLTEIIY